MIEGYHLGMGMEIPGSAFEQGDGERRTWDEMVEGDQPFSAADDEYPADKDGGDYLTTLDDWLSGWGEPFTANTQRRLLAELDGRIGDLEQRIYYRDMAAAAGGAVDATDAAGEKALHAELVEFRERHADPEPDQDDTEPSSGTVASPPEPAAPSVAARPSPVDLVETAINEKLTPSELLHWQELQKGTTQTAIANKLGVSQGAVSKREQALR